ncbi:MAG: sigma-E factor negative regulatory protein [Burkholderiales bacterium]|nr:sigma-E factor negative regulatory protein [Burkholderiales bacterium]
MKMERISALMDGELDDQEAAHTCSRLKNEAELADGWATYHLIGDVLRGERLCDPALLDRIRPALEAEPTVLAPRRVSPLQRPRSIALSAAASAAGVAVVAWLAFFDHPGGTADAPIAPARVAGAVSDAGAVPNLARADSTVNEYLFAHQQYAPSTAMQGVAPFMRTVSLREDDMR